MLFSCWLSLCRVALTTDWPVADRLDLRFAELGLLRATGRAAFDRAADDACLSNRSDRNRAIGWNVIFPKCRTLVQGCDEPEAELAEGPQGAAAGLRGDISDAAS